MVQAGEQTSTVDQTEWLRAVVRVGDGRGFVIEDRYGERLVITAAHCLRELPPAHGMSFTEERTYAKLLGPLGAKPTVYAECLFVDPVADLAVLGQPDSVNLTEQASAYDDLVDAATPLPLGGLPFAPERHILADGSEFLGRPVAESGAWLLALDRHWFPCRVTSWGRTLWLTDAAEAIQGGMSGSPIITPDGFAIGVACLNGDSPQPFLPGNLPGWLGAGLYDPGSPAD